MSEKSALPRTEKKKAQITQQIFHNLLELTELFPNYTIAQHLAGILRRKASEGQEFFFWSNDELLKRVEQYREELESESLTETSVEETD